MSSKTVHGNMYARGSKTITRENIPVQEYRQEGSVGVVNGHGEFGGVLNYGGSGGEWKADLAIPLNHVLIVACRRAQGTDGRETPDPIPRF